MPELAAFQDAFVRALRAPEAAAGPFAQPAMAVYRNTVARGLVDVMRASYPTVERIVGEDWFAASALAFAAQAPPPDPVLADYGAGFAEFLRGFPPAAELAYLPDVAAVDRLWAEAHFAPDEAPLDAAALALSPQTLARGRLRLHASARFGWFETPAATLWRLNRPPAPLPGPEGFDIAWEPEGIALVRPHGEVSAVTLGRGSFALLQACRAETPLGEALAQAVAAEPGLRLDAALAELVAAGAFAAFEHPSATEETGA